MPESVATTTPSVYDLDANHGIPGTKFRPAIGDRERVRPRAGAGVSSDTAFLSTLMVAKAPWSDEVLLEQVRHHALPAMQKQGPVVAGIVDDTGSVTATVHQSSILRSPDPERRREDYQAFVKDLKAVREKLDRVARAH